ncbi:MAG: hypothetical protein AAGF49_11750 [Pseudomonadota bacterium]
MKRTGIASALIALVIGPLSGAFAQEIGPFPEPGLVKGLRFGVPARCIIDPVPPATSETATAGAAPIVAGIAATALDVAFGAVASALREAAAEKSVTFGAHKVLRTGQPFGVGRSFPTCLHVVAGTFPTVPDEVSDTAVRALTTRIEGAPGAQNGRVAAFLNNYSVREGMEAAQISPANDDFLFVELRLIARSSGDTTFLSVAPTVISYPAVMGDTRVFFDSGTRDLLLTLQVSSPAPEGDAKGAVFVVELADFPVGATELFFPYSSVETPWQEFAFTARRAPRLFSVSLVETTDASPLVSALADAVEAAAPAVAENLAGAPAVASSASDGDPGVQSTTPPSPSGERDP